MASLLLQSGLAFADGQGIKVMVNAREQGVKLYERHGFMTVKVISEDRGWTDDPHVTTILIRENGQSHRAREDDRDTLHAS